MPQTTKPRSALLWDVAMKVKEIGPCRPTALQDHFPTRTIEQIQKALENAAARNVVRYCRAGPHAGYWISAEAALHPRPRRGRPERPDQDPIRGRQLTRQGESIIASALRRRPLLQQLWPNDAAGGVPSMAA